MEKGIDSVRLVGSLRASTDCMSCHDGKAGDLLGAFSYRLSLNRNDSMVLSKIPTNDSPTETQPGRYRQVLKDHGEKKVVEKF